MIEWVLAAGVIVLAVQLLVASFHKRDCEGERMQAFDAGRKQGIDHYRESWAAAQADFAKQQHKGENETSE